MNIGLVLALSQVSRLGDVSIEAPLAIRHVRQIEPERESPPPPEQTPEISEPEPQPIVQLALPNLELSAVAPTDRLSLPTVGSFDAVFDLPIQIPAFAAAGPIALPSNATTNAVAIDTPPERETAFDLDRYYPRAARLRGITGTTRIRLVIDAGGRVGEVQIIESTPVGVFEQAAERVALTLRFRPARSGGKPVASEQVTTIQWSIK